MERYVITKDDIKKIAYNMHSHFLTADGEISESRLRNAIAEYLADDISEWFNDIDLADILAEIETSDKDAADYASEVEEASRGQY